MTATDFASLVQARSMGRGKWLAKCPAHADRSPSLAVSEGEEGRVLVRCWAGCETRAILASLSLTMRDLFSAEPMTGAQVTEASKARKAREAVEKHQADTERELANYVRRAHLLLPVLGRRLALNPDHDETAEMFHTACMWLHVAETGLAT